MQNLNGQRVQIILDKKIVALEKKFRKQLTEEDYHPTRSEMIRAVYEEFLTEAIKAREK